MKKFTVDHLSPELQNVLREPGQALTMELLELHSSLQNWWHLLTKSNSGWIHGPILNIGEFGELNTPENAHKGLIEGMWGLDEAGRQYLTFDVHDPEYPGPHLIIAHQLHTDQLSQWTGEGRGYSLNGRMILDILTKGWTMVSKTKIVSECTKDIN